MRKRNIFCETYILINISIYFIFCIENNEYKQVRWIINITQTILTRQPFQSTCKNNILKSLHLLFIKVWFSFRLSIPPSLYLCLSTFITLPLSLYLYHSNSVSLILSFCLCLPLYQFIPDETRKTRDPLEISWNTPISSASTFDVLRYSFCFLLLMVLLWFQHTRSIPGS